MRLIDADALKADCGMADDCKDCKTGWRSCQYDYIYSKMDFCATLDDAETVDAVPVVRCEDCKYWGKDLSGKFDVGGTSWEYCCIIERTTSLKWFCGAAERKEREGNADRG